MDGLPARRLNRVALKQVKTRKPSICSVCKAEIPKGQLSIVRTWTDNLQFFSLRYCSEQCAEA
jgi:hypothetical protein